jgi:hypothetical protein
MPTLRPFILLHGTISPHKLHIQNWLCEILSVRFSKWFSRSRGDATGLILSFYNYHHGARDHGVSKYYARVSYNSQWALNDRFLPGLPRR